MGLAPQRLPTYDIIPNMKTFIKTLGFLSFGVLLGIIATLWYTQHKAQSYTRIIQEKINEKGQLVIVSQTQQVKLTVSKDQSGPLRKLLLGHKVTLLADVKVLIGVKDVSNVKVYFNPLGKCYYLKVNDFDVLAAEVLFPVEYYADNGILYTLLKDDSAEEALTLLSRIKKAAIAQAEEWIAQNQPYLHTRAVEVVKSLVPDISWCEE